MTAAADIKAELLDLQAVSILATVVGVLVAKAGRFPYAVVPLVVELAIFVVGFEVDVEFSPYLGRQKEL